MILTAVLDSQINVKLIFWNPKKMLIRTSFKILRQNLITSTQKYSVDFNFNGFFLNKGRVVFLEFDQRDPLYWSSVRNVERLSQCYLKLLVKWERNWDFYWILVLSLLSEHLHEIFLIEFKYLRRHRNLNIFEMRFTKE